MALARVLLGHRLTVTTARPAAQLSTRPPRVSLRVSLRPRVLYRACSTVAEHDSAKISRWGARLAHDNTFLSYTRNAIISTVAGAALIQHARAEGRPPLAGMGILMMGGMFMYVGSGLYLWQVSKLQQPMRLGRWSIFFSIFNASWPAALWTLSLACLVDEYPSLLLEALRRVEAHLPSVLHASLFVDPPALYPVCKLLKGVVAGEEARLQMVRRHAAGQWSLTKPKRAPLTDLDVASIVVRRIERLEYVMSNLNAYARSERAVPTAYVAPLLEKLRTDIEHLQHVLEADLAPQHDQAYAVWWLTSLLSSEHRRLREELDAVQALSRRIAAVKFTAVEFAARGQRGVRPPPPEEAALRRYASRALRSHQTGNDPNG